MEETGRRLPQPMLKLQNNKSESSAALSITPMPTAQVHRAWPMVVTVPLLVLSVSRLVAPVTRLHSSHSRLTSMRMPPMTWALAIKPWPSPSRIRTSHRRIVLPSHLTFSTGTRASRVPWWMTTGLVMSTYRKPIVCRRSRQTSKSTAGLAPVVASCQMA